MSKRPNDQWNRREFLTTAALAGTGALLGLHSNSLAAEPPLETKRIRIPQIPSACRSPEWVAEELLQIEGFTDVQYLPVQGTQGVEQALASGEADLGGHFAAPVIIRLEAGDPRHVGGEQSAASSCWAASAFGRSATCRRTRSRSPHSIQSLRVPRAAWWRTSAWTRARTSTGQHIRRPRRCSYSPRARSTPISASRRAAGAAREEDRARGGQQRGGPAVVPVLLLHGRRAPGVRPQESRWRPSGRCARS